MVIVIALIFPPEKNSDPLPEPDDESDILQAPEPQILATSTATTTEPEPISEPEERVLPPGVKCLEDCPLIDPDVVEAKIREEFSDAPIMVAVARCESTFYHYDPETGYALKNRQGSSAIGAFQIMRSYHQEDALEMGWDIRDFYGNVHYARYLYETQGLRPWEASRECWGQEIALGENPGNADRDG